MSLLYVNENGAVIGVEGNRCVVQFFRKVSDSEREKEQP